MGAKSDMVNAKAGVASDKRHVYGPRPLSALLPAITRPAFRRAGPQGAQVLADWAAIVGPNLAALTVPVRLAQGTLTIACSGPTALELQHLAPQLQARINTQLGGEPVKRLRFTQAMPGSSLDNPAPARHIPSPKAIRAAEKAVSSVSPGPLRDALAALGRVLVDRQMPPAPATRRRS